MILNAYYTGGGCHMFLKLAGDTLMTYDEADKICDAYVEAADRLGNLFNNPSFKTELSLKKRSTLMTVPLVAHMRLGRRASQPIDEIKNEMDEKTNDEDDTKIVMKKLKKMFMDD